MKADIVNKEYVKIRQTFSRELRKVLQSVTNIPTIQPQEPDYTAALVTEFASIFQKVLSIISTASHTFQISSIFCHQRPIVRMNNSPTGCELGDILFVYYFIDKLKHISLNSLLLQAKVCNGRKCALPKGDIQLRLYMEWPEFYYQKPKITNLSRNIQPKSFNIGAQYLMIDPNRINSKYEPIGVALPSLNLVYDRSLAVELISFLKFKTGRQFEKDPNSSEDHWTKMVWDLINSSVNSTYNRKNIGAAKRQRQPIDFLKQLDSFFNTNSGQIESGSSAEEGINVIMIKVVENE